MWKPTIHIITALFLISIATATTYIIQPHDTNQLFLNKLDENTFTVSNNAGTSITIQLEADYENLTLDWKAINGGTTIKYGWTGTITKTEQTTQTPTIKTLNYHQEKE